MELSPTQCSSSTYASWSEVEKSFFFYDTNTIKAKPKQKIITFTREKRNNRKVDSKKLDIDFLSYSALSAIM